jgi:hypothetical protein
MQCNMHASEIPTFWLVLQDPTSRGTRRKTVAAAARSGAAGRSTPAAGRGGAGRTRQASISQPWPCPIRPAPAPSDGSCTTPPRHIAVAPTRCACLASGGPVSLHRVNRTGRNRSGYHGNRWNPTGPVPVPVGFDTARVKILNLN